MATKKTEETETKPTTTTQVNHMQDMVNCRRQGDVLHIPAESPLWKADSNYKPMSAEKNTIAFEKHGAEELAVLAHGEVTGHLHGLDAAGVEYFATNGYEYIDVKASETRLRHGNPLHAWSGDHGDVQLPGKTTYVIKKQREYQPDGWRQVVD